MAGESTLVSRVDQFFAGTDYGGKINYGGEQPISFRLRHSFAVDPDNQTPWLVTDMIIAESLESNVGSRVVAVVRGEQKSQIVFRLDIAEDKVAVGGIAAGLFRGDAREEFLAGLRIVRNNKE